MKLNSPYECHQEIELRAKKRWGAKDGLGQNPPPQSPHPLQLPRHKSALDHRQCPVGAAAQQGGSPRAVVCFCDKNRREPLFEGVADTGIRQGLARGGGGVGKPVEQLVFGRQRGELEGAGRLAGVSGQELEGMGRA